MKRLAITQAGREPDSMDIKDIQVDMFTQTQEDDSIVIELDNVTLSVRHNDIGVSIDVFKTGTHEEPTRELQFFFDDFEEKIGMEIGGNNGTN